MLLVSNLRDMRNFVVALPGVGGQVASMLVIASVVF
jgi:hypothetical protein